MTGKIAMGLNRAVIYPQALGATGKRLPLHYKIAFTKIFFFKQLFYIYVISYIISYLNIYHELF